MFDLDCLVTIGKVACYCGARLKMYTEIKRCCLLRANAIDQRVGLQHPRLQVWRQAKDEGARNLGNVNTRRSSHRPRGTFSGEWRVSRFLLTLKNSGEGKIIGINTLRRHSWSCFSVALNCYSTMNANVRQKAALLERDSVIARIIGTFSWA